MTLNHRIFLRTTIIGLAAAILSSGCAAPQGAAQNIDARAKPVLKQMCDTLDGAKAVRLRVHATRDRRVETGQMAQFHRTSDITMVRPDRLYAATDSDDGQWTTWYRGKQITVLDRDDNLYATETVPGRISEMLDYMVDHYDLIMPMADLLTGKTYDGLIANVESGTYEGLRLVGDVKCHHLLFSQENIDWQIWIDSGKQPLPRKLVITYTEEPGQPQYVATMDDWDLSPKIDDSLFKFDPPSAAKSVKMADLVAQK
ncbi:MAG TPA: DUF2092 domain-containing protein [Phycisphaerae bacterium]|nr:DUF2092 domain-containing protein [Phycisphaerae bacterium]